jgi:hypothetical protein
MALFIYLDEKEQHFRTPRNIQPVSNNPYLMKAYKGILAILFMAGTLLQCSSRGANSEATLDKPLTPAEKLAADLKAEYGAFTQTYYDSLQKITFIGYTYKGGFDKPDLFRQSINTSLNLIGKEINLKYHVSSATKVDLGEYLWKTPQYMVNLFSSVKMDSVYVRLWIAE